MIPSPNNRKQIIWANLNDPTPTRQAVNGN
ncbi:hypothetical protein Daqu01_00943 [Deinococcus aquaticus]